MVRSDTELTYKIAVALTPGINAEIVRRLEECGIGLKEFLEMPMKRLSAALGLGHVVCLQDLDRQEALFRARQEEEFMNRHSIHPLFLLDADYPVRLSEIPDAPVMLFVLGSTQLDGSPSLAVVGTRRSTSYGHSFCEKFITDLAAYYPQAAIISGLAYGIDAAGHNAALDSGLPTFAVLAHGLDTIYPAQHRDLARRILASGGSLISEYPSGTRPYRNHFLQRNRIVAGMSEVTVVVESEVKGGAMSTANLAFSYNREVYAVPGRYTDLASSGTNMLISRGKARIFTSLADMMSEMRWPLPGLNKVTPPRKNLFSDLEGDAGRIYELLRKTAAPLTIDQIHVATGLPVSTLISTLTELEFEGVVVKLPGARYEAQ
ncbi:MAG: DNA-processing protein DprA [Muribaculaceae bacterium]|nr:DNA-processing protein DprA [Muribaculaceae bacterium]